MIRAASIFLGTSVKVRAANMLRKCPVDSIPHPLLSAAIETIPTGAEEFDRDIIVAACRNGLADLAVLYAVSTLDTQLALEVIGQHGVDIGLKAAVADKCSLLLESSDVGLVCSAIRCLVGIGEARRVRPTVLKNYVVSDVQHMRYCALVAASASALQEGVIDKDVIDLVFDGPDDELAQSFLIAACANATNAILIVSRLVYAERFNPVMILKALLMAAQHEEVRPAVSVALDRLDLSAIRGKYRQQLQILRFLLRQ
jgi:hypothetical protein